jgi:pSer/pThr/pTyr-binding forkhead associated (FHA) protein
VPWIHTLAANRESTAHDDASPKETPWSPPPLPGAYPATRRDRAILGRGVSLPSRSSTDEWRRIPVTPGLSPEAIRSRGAGSGAAARLVDRFGRSHALVSPARLGRELDQVHIGILDESVSRQHAELRQDGATGAWSLVDLGSTNGTFVEGQRVEAARRLEGGELVMLGHVGFVFLLPAPLVRLHLGRDGGVLEHRGREVTLARDELELVRLLGERRDGGARGGFVSSAEACEGLAGRVELDGAAGIARLARRLQATLAAAGLGDLVEHRARAGYRLRVAAETVSLDAVGALAKSRRVTVGSPVMPSDDAEVPR